MRKSILSFQPFTPPFTNNSIPSPSSASAIPSMQTEQTSSPVVLLPSTTSSKNGSKFLLGLRGLPKAFLLRQRRRSENSEEPPLEVGEVDPYVLIKQGRRQTCEQRFSPFLTLIKLILVFLSDVMHSAPSLESPKPVPVLTLSSHHLVVLETDRRDLARLAPIPEYSSLDDDTCYTSSSSLASTSSSLSSSSSSIRSFDDSEPVLGSPQSHWSDDSSSDEFDCTAQLCQCHDLTFTNSSRLCPACIASQDVPEDEDFDTSDVDSLIDSYLEEISEFTRERWSSLSSASTSSSASTHYDPLFSPRSSSTTFTTPTISSPRLQKSRPNTPVDIRDFDMIFTSSPPSPQGKRFHRSTLDARDAVIAGSRPRRTSTQTV